MDALVAATGNAAKALGWDAWLGTLEPGKVADLIVHAKNPLEDLRVLADKASLQFVMKDGEIMRTTYCVRMSCRRSCLLSRC